MNDDDKDNTKNTKIHAAQAIVIGIAYMVILAAYKLIPIYIPFFKTFILLGFIPSNSGTSNSMFSSCFGRI